jgi:uncharacterized protein DUF262
MSDVRETELQDPEEPSEPVQDEAEKDEAVAPVRYDVSSYGIDFDVEGLVKRLKRKDILIPEFQRSYVWPQADASRFVESLLLGLPVPGIFLANEEKTNKLLVIDGQQRLKTLQFFYDGFFNPKPTEKKHRVFSLTNVQERFRGQTYQTLDEADRIKLDNAVLHATIIRQESPPGEDTSMYHIFDRLNTAGMRLTSQELRCSIYHGAFMDLIKELNEDSNWRAIYGKPSQRLKDQELILRFLALYYDGQNYQRPMADFLSRFVGKHADAGESFLKESRDLFNKTISAAWKALDRKAFRLGRALNAAVYDSVMVGIARRIVRGNLPDPKKVLKAYDSLLGDPTYIESVSRSTADEAFVAQRLNRATQAMASL